MQCRWASSARPGLLVPALRTRAQHSPPWKGREPSSSDALRFEARLSPPGPNIASAARLGGHASHSPPLACRCRTSEAPGGGGFGGGCPAWKWELCPPSPGLGCRWAGQEAYRRLGDPVPVVVTGGRCHACAGTPPVHQPRRIGGRTTTTGAADGCAVGLAFGLQPRWEMLLSHLSRGGNYASRGRRARSKHRLARREIWNTVHTTNDVVPRLQPFDDCRRLDIHDAQQTAQLSKPTRSLFITKNDALPIYP